MTDPIEGKEVDRYDHAVAGDEDAYFNAVLYRHDDGRHFIVIEASGMNSNYDGSSGFNCWVEDGDVAKWTSLLDL